MAGEIYQPVVQTVSNFMDGTSGTLKVPALNVSGASTLTGTVTFAGSMVGPNVLNDTGSTNKFVMNPTAKTIVDGSATSLFEVALANSTSAGGMVFYIVQASDGTDFQAMSGMVAYATVDKAGTKTLTITDVTANNAKAVSSGTLTLAWTNVTGTLKSTIKLQPTGSLTETSYTVIYTVFPLVGTVTIL